ncbi:MAG TPA: hypothetical protein VHX62_15110 [Solirubrobacteraceae bacterium]|jgi:hypothetical protein|nr:hypothetical protein [Solirubrobacteraceae bacterium]
MTTAPSPRLVGARAIARLMLLEAATLAAFAALHLSGALHPTGAASGADGAGVAEAIICVVLVAGATTLRRRPETGRPPALASIAFAILGFIVGLTFTVGGGQAIDLGYHLVMLPILILTAVLLWPDHRTRAAIRPRRPERGRAPARARGRRGR